MPGSNKVRNDDSKKSKTRGSVMEDSWKLDIENLSLNDDRWTCVIGMIVETREEHRDYLKMFNEAAEKATRESIFALSYEKLIRETKLVAKSDLHQGICHFASKQMEDQAEAAGSSYSPLSPPSPSPSPSPWLLCRLIKFFINRIKNRQLEIAENRERMEREITREIESLESTPGPKTVAKSKGDSVGAKWFDKLNTKLRKRGEEWKDGVQIDDAPLDGANLYVVLSGFYDKNLIDELLNAGLPLTAVFKVLRYGEKIDADLQQVSKFWSSFETALKDPKTTSKYSQLVCQTFCPPEINVTEFETSKSDDAYRRISFLMYDLCDLKRLHDVYLRKMKLQSGLDDKKPETQIPETYDSIMRVIPEECMSVSMLLDAVISQIDGSKPLEETDQRKLSAETFEERFRRKIDNLNGEYDVFDVNATRVEENVAVNSDPRLIIHGDNLAMNYHPRSTILPENFGIRVVKEFADSIVWKKLPPLSEERFKFYQDQIARISNCFDLSIDDLTTSHYLHLLLFDKMMNGEYSKKSFQTSTEPFYNSFQEEEEEEEEEGKEETKDKFLQCPELLSLVDTEEMIGADLFPVKNIGDFDTVQLLSSDIFPQVFLTCFQQFDAFESLYFPPTDSTLILFYNNRANERVSVQEYSASIRTPVCLRDFSEFVMDEEKEWIEEEEKLHVERLSASSRTKSVENTDDLPLASIYTDADFILSNSLKATDVGKQKSPRHSLIAGMETARYSRDELPAVATNTRGGKEAKETNPGKLKIRKGKGAMINPSNKKEEENLETNPTLENTTSIQPKEDDEPPAFLGYEIANHRIQISGSTADFRFHDETIVKVNREEWRYGETRLKIIVEILGNNFVAQVVDLQNPTFHLTTSYGIFMSFSPKFKSEEERDSELTLGSKQSITKRNYRGSKTGRVSENPTSKGRWMPEMAVDPGFRTSWPSGLVVETIPGDSPSVPFYIKQSYLSKGPECNEISKETHRVFLRDGTIVVFLDDDTVRLMRSNGCIVICDGFVKPYEHGDEHNYLHVIKKTVLEPDGRFYEINNDGTTTEFDKKLVRSSSDYEVGEKFIRRSDGTNILINYEGVLTVSYPDDSRITTGYVIENDLVFCEWTDEEYERFFSSDYNEESRSRDGFVSIFLTCYMEHKNYARVTYDQWKNDCGLSMPGDVEVRLSSEGFLRVDVAAAISLDVKSDEILLKGKTEGATESIFNLKNFTSFLNSSNTFLEMRDTSGNIFEVYTEGKICYKKHRTVSEPAGEGEEESCSSSPSGFTFNSEDNNKLLADNTKGYRLFAVKRDLSSYEHLRHSVRSNTDEDLNSTSTFFHPVNERGSDQKICTSFTPVNPITASKAYLQSYKVKSIRPTNEGRRDLLRSTYSVPWNYLIPYGKKGRGIYENTWYTPLKISPNLTDIQPQVFIVRTIRSIKNWEDDVIGKLKRALRCYWEKTIDCPRESRSIVSLRSASPEEREIEDWSNDFSPVCKKTIDRNSYFDGLSGSRFTKGQESTILKRKISGSRVKLDKEEIEWYKFCLRDHIVPPYFSEIHGACFTWVLECVHRIDEAIEKK